MVLGWGVWGSGFRVIVENNLHGREHGKLTGNWLCEGWL